jgi:uncharacterized SAM-binding protein YcdF (DUF218 family)
MEKINIEQSKEKEKYPFDAIFVLGGGLYKHGDKFYPTDYRQGDEFGMQGAGMRIAAGIDLYLNGQAKNFVFTTGVTEKNKSAYGPDIPTEAETYRDKFLRSLDAFKKRKENAEKIKSLEKPETILEKKSVTTLTNIKECLQIVQDKGWKKIAIMSSDFHIPRIKALYAQALKQHPKLQIEVEFMSAEEVVKKAEPGKYDKVIEMAYQTPEAKKRLDNEARGIEDIKSGKYAIGEFQLKDKNK